MAESTADKTLDPTPHRRAQARAAGQVARSQELSAAILLLGALGAIYYFGPPVGEFLSGLMKRQLGGEPWLAADVPFALNAWNRVLAALAWVMLPILGLIVLCAAAGNVMQTGLLFLPARVVPDFSRLDPSQGLRRMFSRANLARLGFVVVKLVAIGAVGWYSLASCAEQILACGQLPLADLAVFLCETLFGAALKVALALVGLAVLDYAYERWRYERELRMTTQEMREELRNLQGEPKTAARRRARRRPAGGSDLPISPVM